METVEPSRGAARKRRLLKHGARIGGRLRELKAARSATAGGDDVRRAGHQASAAARVALKRRGKMRVVRGSAAAGDQDPFPGKVPHSDAALDKYDFGERVQFADVLGDTNGGGGGAATGGVYGSGGLQRRRLAAREKLLASSVHQMVTSEMLLQENTGFLEADMGEDTADIEQCQLAASVDITSATRRYDLALRQHAPYRLAYTGNGRHLVLAGCGGGHLAAFDAATKRLLCELGVQETIHDVAWLHNENMFAAAQKEWLFVYDRRGTELHCIKKIHRPVRLQFLPHHFLLASTSERGWLSWLDVSVGRLVRQTLSRCGSLRAAPVCHNRATGVLCVGHARGVVSLWAPNSPEPLARWLTHTQPIRGVSVDRSGIYMATASVDRTVKVWDVRTYKCVQHFGLAGGAASDLQWSDTGLLAAAVGNMVEVYRDTVFRRPERAYLRHRCLGSVECIRFCPYEDVLGIGHATGFSSILVPGAGEANYDAYEQNPFETRKQRRETEVKQLLDKIQPELITLEPHTLGQVDVPTLQEKHEAKKKLMYVKTPKIDFTPRNKMKGRSKSLKVIQRKKGVKEGEQKAYLKEAKKASEKFRKQTSGKISQKTQKVGQVKKRALDRFKQNRKI